MIVMIQWKERSKIHWASVDFLQEPHRYWEAVTNK